MLKARKVDNGIGLYDPEKRTNLNVTFSNTTWEIIKTIKKHGKEKATQKIMQKFNIDEKNAKEDIQTILTNLKTLNINIDEIPLTVSEKKYAPRTVHFDVTPRCNSKCIYCFSSDLMSHSVELTKEQIIDTLKKVNDLEMYSLLISGGEPLLRKDIFDILEYTSNFESITWMFTNGMLIDENIAKKLAGYKKLRIQISLDSSNPEHHDLQRGGRGFFEKAVSGIKNLIKYGKTPTIAIVVTRYNYDDLEETVAFLHDLGIKSVRIGTAWVGSGMGKENRNKLFINHEQTKEIGKRIVEMMKKYKGKINFSASPNMFNYSKNPELVDGLVLGCDAGIENLYITSNGDVFPCYTLGFPEFKAGNITKQDITDIWNNSEIFKKFRSFSAKDFDKCKTCLMIDNCEGGCRGNAYSTFKNLKKHDPIRCSYFLEGYKPSE